MGHLSSLGERLTHGLQGAVWIAQVPEDMCCKTSGEHPGFLSVGERQRAISLRIVESDCLLEVHQRRRELSAPQEGVSYHPMCLHEVDRVCSPLGHVEELLGYLMRGL